ncbi:hypothetical protein ATANTOWER_022414, partial [Ataeniobius toweri]|nr:hypothetical protein [Ataeniobius toweri]
VTAVSWIPFQFATWFPADFKYFRKTSSDKLQLAPFWFLSGEILLSSDCVLHLHRC